jgi:uncharacterized membrane protein (DUF106 family)
MTPTAIEVMAIAAVVSLASSLINKKVVDQKRMKEIRGKVNDFQKRYNEAKKGGDQKLVDKLEEEQKEVMKLTTEMMMNSFKPMLYTFIPIIAIFYVLSSIYGKTGNIVDVPFIGELSWFWWYFLIAVITGLCFELVYKTVTGRKK